jgi:hypothetical protein
MHQFVMNECCRPFQNLPFGRRGEDSGIAPMAHDWTLVPAQTKMDKQHKCEMQVRRSSFSDRHDNPTHSQSSPFCCPGGSRNCHCKMKEEDAKLLDCGNLVTKASRV